jgi:hypothetical protein
MARPDPIQYAERLYGAIRAANFSPISFLAFGNAIKDGVSMRNMPRIAAEPFMRVVGEMLDLEDEGEDDSALIDALVVAAPTEGTPEVPPQQRREDPTVANDGVPAPTVRAESATESANNPSGAGGASGGPLGRQKSRRNVAQ